MWKKCLTQLIDRYYLNTYKDLNLPNKSLILLKIYMKMLMLDFRMSQELLEEYNIKMEFYKEVDMVHYWLYLLSNSYRLYQLK